MKKSGRILWAVLAAFLLGGCIGGAFFLYFSVFVHQVRPRVPKQLEEVDRYLSRGYLDLAKQELIPLYQNAESSYTLLRIMKRMVQYARLSDDWLWLNTFTVKSYQARPGNKDFAFLAAYCAHKAQRPDEVRTIVQKKSLPDNLMTLRLVSLLTLEPSDLQQDMYSLDTDKEERELIRLINKDDPLLFESTGVSRQEKKLLLDAALLWMEHGEVQKAYTLAKENLTEQIFDEPVAAICYDSGDLEAARKRFNSVLDRHKQRTDLLLVIGDTWLLESNYSEAKLFYQLVINNLPSLASHPYINLAWVLEQEGRSEEALSVLEQGLAIFPFEGMLVCETAKSRIRSGLESNATDLLQTYLKKEPENAEAWFILLSLESSRLQPEYFQARLWELFERYPGNENLCEYLVWQLLKLKNYQKAALALDIFTKSSSAGILREATNPRATGSAPAATGTGGLKSTAGRQPPDQALQLGWYLHLSGLLLALQGHYDEAVEYITRSLAIREDIFVRYNRAILYKFLKNNGKAREDVLQTLADFQSVTTSPVGMPGKEFLAKVHTLRGELLLNEGSVGSARDALQYALDCNPENADAKFLLNKLEKTK